METSYTRPSKTMDQEESHKVARAGRRRKPEWGISIKKVHVY